MENNVDILLLAAALPPLYLMYRIYKMDQVEREPVGLLVKLMIGGGLITFAAAMIEGIFSVEAAGLAGQIVENFLVVALTEELCKFAVLRFLTWKRPEFNYTFDGVVYAVAASLGFALVENIMYVSAYGMQVALIRAFTAIVAHGVFGAVMGSYYGQARKEACAGRSFASSSLQMKGILMAVILHGFYDFTASQDSGTYTVIFLLIVVGMYVITYRRVKTAQANDSTTY